MDKNIDYFMGVHIMEHHLMGYTEVKFALPCHVWNELKETPQYEEFEHLLLEYQKENIQTLRSTGLYQ